MKILKAILLFSLLLLAFARTDTHAADKPRESMPFAVYTEKSSRTNHFIPSGWMGDYAALKVDSACSEDPHSGATCIRLTYTGEPTEGAGWVGVYWQNPEHNWGSKDGGYNLSSAKVLSFWARGKNGGEKLEFKIGGVTGTYPDSDIEAIGPITLSRQWQRYEIDLAGMDLSYISGGFVFAASRMDNPDGFIVYLDDILYE